MNKLALLLVLSAGCIFAQSASPTRTVDADPSGACVAKIENQFNERNGKLWGCVDSTGISYGTWTQISSSGGGVIGLAVNGDASVNASVALTMPAPSTPTYNAGGTTTCNLALSNACAPTTIATSGTTLALTNPHGAGPYWITLTQPSSSPVANPITFPGTMANCPQPSPTASKITTFQFIWTGAAYLCLGSDDPLDTPITVTTAGTFDAQTDAATITWAIASVRNASASVTLGGDRTLNITNPAINGNYVFKITQDGTGTRRLTLGTGCTWKVISGGAGAITLSTAANSVDVLAFTYDGTNCLANLGKNYN